MNILASVAIIILALLFIGYGVVANFAAGMADTDSNPDKGGCICIVIGLAMLGGAVWIAWP